MRRGERVLILCGLLVLLLGGCATLQEPGGQASSFRTLRRGSSPQEEGVVVVRTAEELKELWDRLHPRGVSKASPAVDFSQETVVGVFRGCLPNTCYRTEVRDVSRAGERALLWVVDTDPGAHCSCGMAITCPYHLVAVPKFDAEPEVRRTSKTTQCTPQRRP